MGQSKGRGLGGWVGGASMGTSGGQSVRLFVVVGRSYQLKGRRRCGHGNGGLGGGESIPPFLFLSNIILTWQTHTHGAAHAVMQVNACVAWEVPDAASGGVMPHIFTGEGTRATHSHAACLALFRLTRLID